MAIDGIDGLMIFCLLWVWYVSTADIGWTLDMMFLDFGEISAGRALVLSESSECSLPIA